MMDDGSMDYIDPKTAGELYEIMQDRIDAQRYRNLKAFMKLDTTWGSRLLSLAVSDDIDSAVDALPEPEKS